MPSPWKAAAAAAILAALSACVLPTDTCACTPARAHAVAFGTVRGADGAPVAGARMHALVAPGGCASTDWMPDPPSDPGRPLTAANGSYELRFYSFSSGAQQCVRVVAERAPGDSAYTEVAAFPLGSERDEPARRQVDVGFP